MPDVPIIDAHVHLWDPTRFRMAWLDSNAQLNRPFGLADFREHTAGLEIAAMVYVQVDVADAYGLLEAQWAAARAQEDSRLRGIVAWAPIEFGAHARAYLDALTAVSPRIKGVRRLIQSESLDFCIQPRFIEGLKLLPAYGFSFDICIYHPQLPSVIEMVRRCPEVSFMLDHIGKPNIKERLLDPWRAQLRELASFPNVMCKISGIVTEADHQRWTAEDLRPYIEHVLDCFGEDRVAFGGDWPVVLLASSYRRWVETLDFLTAHLTAQARRKLWADNARRFYRLDAA